MPWKECHVMDERLRFVARRLEGEKMAPLCAEFGISRKTGTRFSIATRTAASPRSRIAVGRRYRQANRRPPEVEAVIVRLKREYPGWGAPKIREKLRRQSTAPQLPAISTVQAVPRARRAMRLRRYQQPVMLKTGFVQRVRRAARREGSRRRARRRAGRHGAPLNQRARR